MSSVRTILLTGATGNVGIELCRWLLRTYPGARVRVLVRAMDAAELRVRWARTVAAAWGSGSPPLGLAEHVALRGDVARPDLGLSPADRDALLAELTDIVHSASLTSFAATPKMLRGPNVDGLRNVLGLARSCRKLRAVAHLSTCFTAGRREGLVLESDLAHDRGFVNDYEASKYESESIARASMRELPLSVYRLSLLVGRRDGYVHRPGAFHYFLEQLYAGLLPLIPGHPEARFDLLPTDYAVEIFGALFFERFQPSMTYHVAAGEHAPTTGEWLRMTTDCYREASSAWRSGAHVPPDIVELATYRHLVDTVNTVGNKTLGRMLNVIDTLAEYPLSTKVFDRRNVRAALGDERSAVPALKAYYPTIIRTGVANQFWRQQQGAR